MKNGVRNGANGHGNGVGSEIPHPTPPPAGCKDPFLGQVKHREPLAGGSSVMVKTGTRVSWEGLPMKGSSHWV